MKIGIGNMIFGMDDLDVLEQIEWVRYNGFDAVDFHTCPVLGEKMAVDPHNFAFVQLQQLHQAVSEFRGVEIHAPFSNYDICLTSPNLLVRKASLKELSFSIKLAGQIGATVVTVHTGTTRASISVEQQRRYLTESLTELDILARESQIKVLVEIADFFLLSERLVLLDELSLSHVGIALDVGHLEAYERFVGTTGRIIRRFSKRIWHLHVHDCDGRRDHLAIGRGKIDFDDIVRALKDVEYRGILMLELDPTVVSPKEVILSRNKLREFLERHCIYM